MTQTSRYVLAAVLWSAAVTLIATDSIAETGTAAWGLLLALGGTVFVCWAVVVEERQKMERLSEAIAVALAAEQACTRI